MVVVLGRRSYQARGKKSGYDDAMKWRGALAALLALFLAAGPSSASICALACTGAAQRQVCPICGSGSHTAAAHMHCAQMDEQESPTAIRLDRAASSPCVGAFCDQEVSASLPTKVFRSHPLRWTASRPALRWENGVIPGRQIDSSRCLIPVDSGSPPALALRI
jgi:hypothetical protein